MINLSPIIFAIVGVFAVIGALIGLSRGLSRQIVRTVTIVLSVVISYIVAVMFYSSVSGYFEDKTINDLLNTLIEAGLLSADANLTWLESMDVQLAVLAMSIPYSLIIMPIIFVVAFILTSLITLIFHKIICGLCRFRARGGLVSRLLGLLLGLIQGVAVAGFLLLPIVGIGNVAKDSVALLNEKVPDESFTETCNTAYDNYLKSVTENPIVSLYSSTGINALYESIATVEINGEDTNMTTLMPDTLMIATDAVKLQGVDFKSLTSEQEEAIKSILTTVDQNNYLKGLIASSVKSISYAYTDGTISLPVEDPFASIIDSAVSIFHTSDSTNISGDLNTISDVLFILSKDGVLLAFDEGSDAMLDAMLKRDAEGNTSVNRVITTIKANERTKPLVTLITKLSVTVMSQQAGISSEAINTYENIKTSLNNDILSLNKEDYATEEEYVADVSDKLDATLKENNITLEKDIVDTMAQYVSDNYSDVDEITDDEASDIILSYYDAYLEYLETNEIPEGITPPVIE